jgi:nucleoside-diphosphate-sugar epimerase
MMSSVIFVWEGSGNSSRHWELLMRVLVTGATGFVGSHLTEALVARGDDVRVLARRTSQHKWIESLPLTWFRGDVNDPESLNEAVRDVDHVYHVAGMTKANSRRAYLQANAAGTRNLIEACLRSPNQPAKFILMSSLAAAGPAVCPKTEIDPCEPVSHYGHSKFLAERIACSYADRLPLVILRPSAVYGPRDRDILAFFRLVKRGLNLTIGRATPCLCLVYVADLVDAAMLAADKDLRSGSTFFVSDGEVHDWETVAELLGEIMGVRVRTVRIPSAAAYVAAVGAELWSHLRRTAPLLNRQKIIEMQQTGWTCEIRKANQILGFHPRVPLAVGLAKTYRWYRAQGWL